MNALKKNAIVVFGDFWFNKKIKNYNKALIIKIKFQLSGTRNIEKSI